MEGSPLDLNAARARLLRAREALLHRQGDLREDEGELLGVREADPVDAGTAEGDAIPLDSLGQNEQATLGEISDALGRVEDGSYGLCERCGCPIEPRRLEALPWARRCFACESEYEKEHRSVNQV